MSAACFVLQSAVLTATLRRRHTQIRNPSSVIVYIYCLGLKLQELKPTADRERAGSEPEQLQLSSVICWHTFWM